MLGFKIVAGKREPKTFRLLTAVLMVNTGKILKEKVMACQQAKFTDAAELARFIAQLVQLGTDFDCVQISAEEWVVDLS
jgi:uncharacterized Fe-S center protein